MALLTASAVMLVIESVTARTVSGSWTYFTPLGNVAPLFLGSALALLEVKVSRRVGAPALVLLVVLAFTHLGFYTGPVQAAVVASGLVVAWLGADPGAPGLASRPAVWLGQRSYSLYLIHEAVLRFVQSAINPPRNIEVIVISLPVSLLLSEATFRAVERPTSRLRHGRSARLVAST